MFHVIFRNVVSNEFIVAIVVRNLNGNLPALARFAAYLHTLCLHSANVVISMLYSVANVVQLTNIYIGE